MAVVIEQYLPSILLIIIGAVIGVISNRREKKRDEYRIEREKYEKEQEQRMSDWFVNVKNCLSANNAATIAMAIAIRDGKINGELDAAIRTIKEADDGFNKFLTHTATTTIAKR